MRTADELCRASEARAELHLHQADRAYGLGQMFRDETGDRDPNVSRAKAAASRAFWAAGDAHYAAADAHEVAAACNTGDEPQEDEFDYANEASHAAREAFRAAIRAGKAAELRDPKQFDQADELTAANEAETAARLVREAEDVAERCLNGR